MRNPIKALMAATALMSATVLPGEALAWGDQGHRMIAQEALRALPEITPAFLRAPQAIDDVGELAREPDRWRDAGFVHDSERDAAHFIDLRDDGTTFAGVPLKALPRSRMDYEMAVVAAGEKPWKAGYLPYATIDLYQQVAKDMAYWRVLSLLEGRETDPVKKAWYTAERVRREHLMLRDIGELAHYVGDGTQPLHLSIHYNGWGNFPNPEGFTNDRIHVPLEGPYVSRVVMPEAVRAGMSAYVPCTAAVEVCVTDRLNRNFAFLVPMYQLEKDGGFAEGDPRGVAFMQSRVAQGASDLRDMLIDAWRDSKTVGVGYPMKTYDDFVGNAVADPWLLLHGE